ncbi:MAG TPA: hypothetical protein VKB80_08465 [Kofleriaceae bacterium]|nr:hypothetical protein [Kofleriaceae bacterium]
MGQVILWAYVQLVGLALATACGWARRPMIGCALGFPLGLVAWGSALIALLWLGLPLVAAIGAAAIVLAVAAGAAAWRRRADVDGRALAAAAAALAITAAVAALATAFPLAIVAERGHRILLAATAIGRNVDSIDFIWNILPSPPVFQASLHAAAPLVAGRPFFAALSPLCGIAAVVLLAGGGAELAGRGAGRAVRALLGLVLAAALCSFLFAVQATAVDLHAAAALFVIAFLVAHAIGEESAAPASIWAELLLLLGFALQGLAESVAASAMLLAIYGCDRRDPARLARPIFLYTAVLTAWHLLLWEAIGRRSLTVEPREALALTAAPVLAWAGLLAGTVRLSRPAPRRALALAAAGLLVVGIGLALGWTGDGDPGERWTAAARWFGRYRPGLSDCLLLGLAAVCVPLARGSASAAAAASVCILAAVELLIDLGEPIDPRELAGPLRVAAAAPALLLVMLTGVRLLTARRDETESRLDSAATATTATTATSGTAPARVNLLPAPRGLFAAVVAILLLTNVHHQVRAHRLTLRDARRLLAAGPTSLAGDERQFAYYLMGEWIPGATVVIPPRLADHAVFFRVLGRVAVEIAESTPRLRPDAVAQLAPLRAARRPLYYHVAAESESVYLLPSPRSSRYVLAEASPGTLYLLPEPLYFWSAIPAPGAAGAAR